MIDLKDYPTETLKELLKQIKSELGKRSKAVSTSKRRKFISEFNPSNYDNAKDANAGIEDHNSSGLFSLRNRDTKIHEKEKYLPALIKQDWSSVYPDLGGDKKYYVYVHTDPRARILAVNSSAGGNYGGTPFYVGKGTGDRAFNLKRNQGHGKIIKEIIADGYDESDIVKIIFSDLSESKAYEIESKLIYFFTTVYENKKNGVLYNLDIPKKPKFTGPMEKIVLNRQFL